MQYVPENWAGLVSVIDCVPVSPSFARMNCYDVLNNHVPSWACWCAFELRGNLEWFRNAKCLENGEEEPVAKDDDGGSRHYAEADEQLLGQSAYDELDLIRSTGQP